MNLKQEHSSASIWQRWWEFETRVVKDAFQTSRDTLVDIRNSVFTLGIGFVMVTIAFREYIDPIDIYASLGGAFGLGVLLFIWRNHCAVLRIYKKQADELEFNRRIMLPRVTLDYVKNTCCRETWDTHSGNGILYFSVEVSGPPVAVIRNVRVFLNQVEREDQDGAFESVGIAGSPSLAWTVSDEAPDDTYMPTNIGPGHTRVVNVFRVPFGHHMVPCTRAQHNRERDLLKDPGTYRFIVRANCDDWSGYAELVLRATWNGNARDIEVQPERA